MDKKKIYIIIIVVCFLVTAGVLYYGFFSQPAVEVPTDLTLNPVGSTGSVRPPSGTRTMDVSSLPLPDKISEYAAPSIFPQDSTLDLDVYGSARFKSLQDYVPLTVTPEEIGRENPFDPYQ